ncbi:MAG TPA: TolC family protein [Bacteroidales bacterium]|nr:TolC family protein [Bacteroidales bacterium]
MKRKVLILIIMIISRASMIQAQKLLTLKECYDLAITSNALSGEKEAYSEISKLKDNNLAKNWLPTIDAGANLVYNSEVVDMSGAFANIPIPGFTDAIKPLPHEQYRITVDINQVIYDGGSIKGARALEQAGLHVNEKQTETDLYKIRGQVNGYYFNLLLLNRQKNLLNNYLELIYKRISAMQSALNNGVILKSDIDVLTSEKIRLEQQLAENDIRKNTLLKILSDLIGQEINTSTEFILTDQESDLTDELFRPELQLFELRNEQLNASMKLLDSRRMPKAFGFATLGYGNPPGNNFFKDEFAPYYVVGAGIKWNIFDWNKVKNEKKVITTQRGIIENRKTDLTDNLKRQLESKNAEIESLQSLIITDNELITLRKRITASAESQYENGTITASEYLNELNSEKQTVINNEIHKINLAMARIEYLNISGKDIK